jgi:hypothetical protein
MWLRVDEYSLRWNSLENTGIVWLRLENQETNSVQAKSLQDVSNLGDILRNETFVFFNPDSGELATGWKPAPPPSANTIDIYTAFDTQALLGKGKQTDPNNPTVLDSKDVFMVVNARYLVNNQASADLVIRTKKGDNVRWRAASTSGNATQTAAFYKFEHNTGDVVVSNVGFTTCPAGMAIPQNNNPETYQIKTQDSAFMQGTVVSSGAEKYRLFFYIVDYDRSTDKYIPYYFVWGAGLTVES